MRKMPKPKILLVFMEILYVGVTWSFPSSPRDTCSKCKPGTFLVKSCTSDYDTQCKPCPIGTFTDANNLATECNACSQCPIQTYEAEPCISSKNTMCVTCSTTPGKISKSYSTRCWKGLAVDDDPLELMLSDDPGPGDAKDNSEHESGVDGGAAPDQPSADNPASEEKLIKDDAPKSDGDANKDAAPVSDGDVNKDDAPASDGDVNKNDAPASDGEVNKNDAPVSDGDVNKDDAPASDGDVNKNDAPASDGEVNKNDAPASDGDVNKDDAPASDGDVNKDDAPASDGDVNKDDAPASDVDVKKDDAPASDGDVNKDDAPASDGDVNKDDAPASGGEVNKDDAPASDGDVNKDDAPALDDAPASDGDANTNGDKANDPSILDVHIDEKFVTDDQTNSLAGEDQSSQVVTSEPEVDAGVLAKEGANNIVSETTPGFDHNNGNQNNYNTQHHIDGSQVTDAAHVNDGDVPLSETSTSSVHLESGEDLDKEKEADENLIEPIIHLKTGNTKVKGTTEGSNDEGENSTSLVPVVTGVSDESSTLGGHNDAKEDNTHDDKKVNSDENLVVGRLLDDSTSNVTSDSDPETTTRLGHAAAVDGERLHETMTLITEENTTHVAGLLPVIITGELGNDDLNFPTSSTPLVSSTTSLDNPTTAEGRDTPSSGPVVATSNITENVQIDEPETSIIEEVNIAPVKLEPEDGEVTQPQEANTTTSPLSTTMDGVVPDADAGEDVVVEVVEVTTKKSRGRILTLEEADAEAEKETVDETGSGEIGPELGLTTEEDKESVRVDSSHHKGEEDDGDSRRKTAIIVGVSVGGVALFALAFFVSRKVCRKKGSFKVMKKVTRNGGNEEIEFRPVDQSEEDSIKASKTTNGLYRQGPNVGPPSPRGKQNINQEPEKEDDIYALPIKKSRRSLETPSPLILSESPQEPLIKNLNNEEKIKYIDDSTDDEGMSSVRERLLPLKSTSPNLSNVIEEKTPPQTPSITQSPSSSPTSKKSETSVDETQQNKVNGTSPRSVSTSSQGSLTKDMVKILQKTDQPNGDKNKRLNKQGKIANVDGDIEC